MWTAEDKEKKGAPESSATLLTCPRLSLPCPRTSCSMVEQSGAHLQVLDQTCRKNTTNEHARRAARAHGGCPSEAASLRHGASDSRVPWVELWQLEPAAEPRKRPSWPSKVRGCYSEAIKSSIPGL